MGIVSVLDLLMHYPRRIHDRTATASLADLEVGAEATVVATVVDTTTKQTRNRRAMVVCKVEHGTARMEVTFFNQPWRAKQLAIGTEVALFGKVESFGGRLRFTNPVVDVIGAAGEARTGVIVPVYPQSGKADLSTWEIAPAARRAVEFAGDIYDPVDAYTRDEVLVTVDRTTAFHDIHLPESAEAFRKAERRLRFDEFLVAQVGLVARKRALAASGSGIRHVASRALADRFLDRLGFSPTPDQLRAIAEIHADLGRPAPMHRLLQGDVGSGKTVVALAAMLMAVEGGYQAALMAPTAVLAEQLYAVARRGYGDLLPGGEGANLLGESDPGIRLLTNRSTAKERAEIAAGLRSGTVHVVIGTHALLYGESPFTRLGLVVIDEHHRFGVEQREVLKQRAEAGSLGVPDVLVMTATPIPRTAALLVYGDLEVSVLRAMPAGRQPIATILARRDTSEVAGAYARVRSEVAAGHQAYVVCPLVEGSERVEARAATERVEELRHGELSGLRLGLLHGQMPAADKEAVMDAFRARELDVLVATTVIEVGVDVPNATVMVIEDAQRFGLAQLHQLRGRVGRGGDPSWCHLIADTGSEDAAARMEAMVATTDGFVLAERDLEIRGTGQVFGERQSGQRVDRHLRLARLPRDERYVDFARRTAETILEADPDLADHRPLAEEVEDLLGADVEYLFKS